MHWTSFEVTLTVNQRFDRTGCFCVYRPKTPVENIGNMWWLDMKMNTSTCAYVPIDWPWYLFVYPLLHNTVVQILVEYTPLPFYGSKIPSYPKIKYDTRMNIYCWPISLTVIASNTLHTQSEDTTQIGLVNPGGLFDWHAVICCNRIINKPMHVPPPDLHTCSLLYPVTSYVTMKLWCHITNERPRNVVFKCSMINIFAVQRRPVINVSKFWSQYKQQPVNNRQ